MIKVDSALISGYDIRNDNISILRTIGDNAECDPHPDLVKLFDHYRYIMNTDKSQYNSSTQDQVLQRASVFWLYQIFYNTYGEKVVFRKPTITPNNKIFLVNYLTTIDPLIIALSVNSMSYLFFCTCEHHLVENILRRLTYLSKIWQDNYAPVVQTAKVIVPWDKNGITSIWPRYLPTTDPTTAAPPEREKFKRTDFIPRTLTLCFKDIYTAFQLYRLQGGTYGVNVPSDADISVFLKTWAEHSLTVQDLIAQLKRIENIKFDLQFIFGTKQWQCTYEEFTAAVDSREAGYNNQYLWLLLCYLHKKGSLRINNKPDDAKLAYGTTLGHAMFDYHVLNNSEKMIEFINRMQFKKNLSFKNDTAKGLFIQTIKKYRGYGFAVDAKKLKIKRGALVNLLSLGFGDLFCVAE